MPEQQCRNGHFAGRNKFGACRECLREADRRWREKYPGRASERTRKWERENPEKALESRRKLREKNREKINEQQRAWRERHPDKIKHYLKKWRLENLEAFDCLRKKWKAENPEKVRQMNRRRQAARRASMPEWADRDALRAIYDNCPEGYEVDHIVPISGANVCGLHVPWNLQYLTPEENKRKGNRAA